jgi:hypothetical protein
LVDLGIDAAVVGDKVALKWVENGKWMTKEIDKNNAEVIQSTVAAIWNKKYEGAMKKQSKTFLGQWSTLKDNFNLTMQAMTKGVFEFARGGLSEANEFFNLFNRKMAEGLDPVHAALSALHVTLDQVFGKEMGDQIDATLRRIVSGVEAVAGVIGELAIDLARGDFSEFFADLGEGAIDLGVITVTAAFDLIGDAAKGVWNWFLGAIGLGPRGGSGGTGAADVTPGFGIGGENTGTAPVDLGTIFVTAALKLGGEIAAWAGNLWGWLKEQLGLAGGGGHTTGADVTPGFGPGGAGGGQEIDLGDVAINVASWIAGKMADLATFLGTWAANQVAKIEWGALGNRLKEGFENAVNSIDWGGLGFEAGQLTRALAIKFGEAIAGLASWLANDVNWGTVGKAILIYFVALPATIGYLGTILIPKAAEFLQGFAAGLGINWPLITGWLRGLPQRALEAVGGLSAILMAKGGDLMAGLKEGAIATWEEVSAWLIGRKDQAVSAIGSLASTLYQQGVDLLQGLKDGAIAKWLDVMAWLVQLPNSIWAAVGTLSTTLYQKGVDLLQGLQDGAIAKWLELMAWLVQLPNSIFSSIGLVTATLYQKGVDLIQGLMDGWQAKSAELAAWAANLGAWVAGMVPDLSGYLYGAGVSLVQGFINGVDAMLGALRSKIGELLGAIPGSGILGAIPHARGGVVNEPLSLVGERGPELVSLPRGSFVHTAAKSAAMMRGGRRSGGGGDTYYLVDLGNAIVGRGALQELQRLIAEGTVRTYDGRLASARLAGR